MSNNDYLSVGSADKNSEITLLETGAYLGTCVAVTVRMMRKYQSTDVEPKVQFVYQIVDGETKHYLRTAPIRIVNNTEGTLNKLMLSWLKMDAQTLTGFSLASCVGKPAQVVVDSETRNDKTYNNITNVLATRSNQIVEVVPDTLPEFLTRDCVQVVLAEGIQQGQPRDIQAVSSAPQQIASGPSTADATVADSDGDEKLPF